MAPAAPRLANRDATFGGAGTVGRVTPRLVSVEESPRGRVGHGRIVEGLHGSCANVGRDLD